MREHPERGLRPRVLIGLVLLLGALALGGSAGGVQAQGTPPKPAMAPGTVPGCVALAGGWGAGSDTDRLFAVSALGPDDMWAVGSARLHGTRMMVEHWDGQSWTGGTLYDLDGTGILLGVAMAAHDDVWAVGSDNRIEHWNGTLWSLVANPTRQDLNTIVAISPTDVWAAGGNVTVHWDGSVWSNIVNPIGAGSIAALAGRAANDVWAVGGSDILHWDGAAWSRVPNGPVEGLVSVAAPAANDAWAVGSVYTPGGWMPGVEHWDGTAWSAVSLPTLPGTNPVLTGISAGAANDVWAVGSIYGDSDVQTLVLHWDGTAWAVIPSGNADYDDNRLLAVSAPAPGVMWAVGIYERWYRHYDTGLTLRYTTDCTPPPVPCDGTFHIIPSPNVYNDSGFLYGVAASAPDNAWAVGAASAGGTQLLTHWDGQRWQRVGPVNKKSLYAISARSAADIWAVGDTILHWDGTQWTAVPGPSGLTGSLRGVVAIAADDAWAVGDQIIHWNGRAWHLFPRGGLPPGPDLPPLRAVAAAGPHDVWAVGGNQILHWDGATWQSVATPPGILFNGVAALSSTDAWAVGSTTNWLIPHQRIVHWDGAAWTVDPTVNGYGTFYAVAARTGSDVWTVGTVNDGTIYHSFPGAAHWNGLAWAAVGTALPSYTPGNPFYAVAPVPRSLGVWAVGNSSSSDTLTEWFQPACSDMEK